MSIAAMNQNWIGYFFKIKLETPGLEPELSP